MAEELSNNSIEAEIAELSQKIAEKRKQLESSSGVVEERELVKSAIAEKLSTAVPQSAPVATTTATQQAVQAAVAVSGGKSYLDTLDPDSRLVVEGLIESVFTKGMTATFKMLEMEEPYIIDAFHDVLTDKLYSELKKRGIIK